LKRSLGRGELPKLLQALSLLVHFATLFKTRDFIGTLIYFASKK